MRTVREGLLDRFSQEQVAQLADLMDAARGHLREIVPLIPPRSRHFARATSPRPDP